MRRRFSKPTQPLEEAQINLTSLIDVVFVILIMFIVVAPLLEQDRIELAQGGALQQENQVAVQEKAPITIHVLADNTIELNRQRVDLGDLEYGLKKSKERYPLATPQLFHDRKASFGTYQSIKNAAEHAGFTQLDVILKPQ